jgi:hypothetical protein
MAQNSWQKAREREIAKAQITTVGEMYTQMIQTMAKEVINHKNTVIEALVKEELGVEVLLDMAEITRRGFLAPAVDGSEVFHWDNKPRIYFAPVDMVMKDDTMRPVLKWQRIPIVAEPKEGVEPEPTEASDTEGTEKEEPWVDYGEDEPWR